MSKRMFNFELGATRNYRLNKCRSYIVDFAYRLDRFYWETIKGMDDKVIDSENIYSGDHPDKTNLLRKFKRIE